MTTKAAILSAPLLAAALAGCASAGVPLRAAPATGVAEPGVLRVMTLNVAHGARAPVPPFFHRRRTIERNLSDIAALVRREEPDVVAFEELDRRSFFSAHIDHFAWIQEESGYPYGAFGAHRDVPRGPFAMRHGTALLAATPLDFAESVPFRTSVLDDKGLVVATIRPPSLGGQEIDVVAIHLDPFFEGTRRAHVRRTIAELAARGARPLVILGDMNAAWKDGKESLGELARGLGLRPYLGDDAEQTYSARQPWRRIDWILISRELDFRGYRTLPDVVSDHRAVVAEIVLDRANNGVRAGAME